MLYKKVGIPERKYKSHSSENYFGKGSKHKSNRNILGGSLGNRNEAVKKFQKYAKKWRRELKSLKKQNKIIFRMTKRSGSHHELKKIKNIRSKAPMNNESSNNSSSSSDSDYSLSSEIGLDKIRHPSEIREIKKLDHVMTSNIKNRNQCDYDIEYDPKFDDKLSLSGVAK